MADDVRVVVVGIDGSGPSLFALRAAVNEAQRRDAHLHVVHVADYTPAMLHLPGGTIVDTADIAAARRREVWERAEQALAGIGNVERVDLDGYPADTLVDYCQEVAADLLVLGTRGRGRMASTFLGSTSLRALERAHCDVLIAKPR
ncbi:MAG TPA: universal stress protein [Acidimicrobiia bacterium]